MDEKTLLVLRALRGVMRSEEPLTELERQVLLQMIEEQIEFLESMETPKPRREGKKPKAKATS